MDPEELIRGLVSVGLVVVMSLGANCQGAAGHELQAPAVPAALHGVSNSSQSVEALDTVPSARQD